MRPNWELIWMLPLVIKYEFSIAAFAWGTSTRVGSEWKVVLECPEMTLALVVTLHLAEDNSCNWESWWRKLSFMRPVGGPLNVTNNWITRYSAGVWTRTSSDLRKSCNDIVHEVNWNFKPSVDTNVNLSSLMQIVFLMPLLFEHQINVCSTYQQWRNNVVWLSQGIKWLRSSTESHFYFEYNWLKFTDDWMKSRITLLGKFRAQLIVHCSSNSA